MAPYARSLQRRGMALVCGVCALSGCSALTDLGGLSGGEDETPGAPGDGDGGSTAEGTADGGPVGVVASPDSGTPDDAAGACTLTGTVETVEGTASVVVDAPGVGTQAWKSPLDARAQDGLSASVMLDGLQTSYWLVATGFGMTVPSGAAIRGFSVSVRRKAGFPDEIADHGLALVRQGVPVATLRSKPGTWGTSFVTVGYGGPSDTWGEAWTANEVASAGFGVALAVRGVPAYSEEALVDALEVRVHFERCE